MHILMISLDNSLASGYDASVQRHLAFAERVASLTIIVRTMRGHSEEKILSPQLRLFTSASWHPALFLLDALRLARKVKAADLIVTQDMFLSGLIGWVLRRRFRVPLLVQNHSYVFGNREWLNEHPLRNRVLLAIAHFVRARADFLRTVNQTELKQYIDAGGDRARVAALPLATASTQPSDMVSAEKLSVLRAELGLPDDAQVILWFGNPLPFKRVPILLKVFDRVILQHPRARLLLVGDLGRSRENLSALIARLGLSQRVILHGPVAHAELAAYYALGSVYALTSAYEGVPRVLLEASAAGLPLVAMRAVGVDEVIEDGVNGFLMPDGDINGMANRIIELLHDPARAHMLGEQARAMALARYNASRYADDWVGVWQRAVSIGLQSPFS
jgi:glycosyltransferase involved in cell wall biosynthesis